MPDGVAELDPWLMDLPWCSQTARLELCGATGHRCAAPPVQSIHCATTRFPHWSRRQPLIHTGMQRPFNLLARTGGHIHLGARTSSQLGVTAVPGQ